VTDDEWSEFFSTFLIFFQACDADKDNLLNPAEMAACLATGNANIFSGHPLNDLADRVPASRRGLAADLHGHPGELHALRLPVPAQDQQRIGELRRQRHHAARTLLNFNNCKQKLYCALSITSPRTRHIFSPEEKQMYLSAVVLTDGFYYGQTSYLTPMQLIGVSYIYNYFSDYELPYNDGVVTKADFVRSVQEGNLPIIYNPLVVDFIFEDMDQFDFYTLCQTIFGLRQYLANSLPNPQNPQLKQMIGAKFSDLIKTYPARLQYLVQNSDVPTQADIETNSTQYWLLNSNPEDNFLRNFNNLIFLEKKNRVQQVPIQVQQQAAALTFTPGDPLFFNMMNWNTNGFASLAAYLRFYRFASMYLEFDPLTQQALSYDLIVKKKKPLTLQCMCADDKFLFNQMLDYLAGKPDFFLNFKEFIEWFMITKVFGTLKNTGH